MRITMTDIRHRLSKVGSTYSRKATINVNGLYEQAVSTCKNSVVRRALSNWETLAENDISSLSKLLDIYDAVAESGNIGLLKMMTSEICEDAIPKVRNGMETNNLVKHRVARFKTKVQTKIQNKINDIEDLVDGKKISDAQAAVSAAQQSKTIAQANGERDNGIEQEPQEECYNKLLEAANKVVSCDRVIENYNSISKRFNIDRTIRENASLGTYDIAFEVCKLVETYDMPLRVRYNTALESCIYGLEKNGIKYEAKDVVAGCTEYFLLKEKSSNDITLKELKGILEDAQLFDPETDFEDIEYITEEEPEDDNIDNDLQNSLDEEYDMIHEKEVKKFSKSIANANKNEVKDLINSIKALPDKTPEKIKAIIRKIYAKSPEQVIEGMPNLLSWIRVGLVCSTLTTMGPLCAIIIFIVDQFIAMGVKRANAEKMVKKFTSDIESTRKKIEKTKDEEEKKRLEEYLKTLIKQTDRLVEYRDSLHTDEENMNREPDNYDTDNDLDLGDDFDLDLSFDESYSLNTMIKDIETISEIKESFEKNLVKNISHLDYQTSDILIECLASIPDIVNYRALIEVYDNLIDEERAKPGLNKYQKIDTYKMAKYALENAHPIVYDYQDPYTSIKVFQAMKEVYEAVDMLGKCEPTVLNELSFANSIKMAREKIKKGLTKLSDTERAASKTIDMSAEKIEKNVERSMSSDNREMIIKGSLLPSASKCLKTALAAGATAVLINPVIAIIGVLGKMACSKKYKAKERQLILDEIEVELQMVDKYLKVAEDKNDMQATKHLLTTKRTLERERQRIKYNMDVKFKQHVPGTGETDYDNY